MIKNRKMGIKKEITGKDLYALLAFTFLLLVAVMCSDIYRGFHRF